MAKRVAGDLLTLRQHELPVKLVVFRNDALAFVELEMKAAGLLDFATGLRNPNFARLATAVDAADDHPRADDRLRLLHAPGGAERARRRDHRPGEGQPPPLTPLAFNARGECPAAGCRPIDVGGESEVWP
jgi:hypothetical protein